MIQVLMPMAGSGRPFELQGQAFPKSLVELFGRPLVEYAVNGIRIDEESRFIFVISESDQKRFHLDNVLHLLVPNCEVIVTHGATCGALCSALLAVDCLDPSLPLLVCNGDQHLVSVVKRAVGDFRARSLDIGIITFHAVHPRWSFVLVDDDGAVLQTAEKQPISDHATVGVYYYRTAALFLDSAEASLLKNNHYNKQFYVCPSINEAVLKGYKVGIHSVKENEFFPLGTPEDIKRFETQFDGSQIKSINESGET